MPHSNFPLEQIRLKVLYDDKELYPTPLVNYSHQPVTFGYVYGYNSLINLEGIITGIESHESVIEKITGFFKNQFKKLEVREVEIDNEDSNGNLIYSWENITIDEVSLEQSQYLKGGIIKYSVKCLSFDVPSGVIDPSNEYSFAQNEDGTVNVTHKISARGVRNNNEAFENAINFVKIFTGKDPFNNCAPYFVPSGSGVLLSLSENINRVEGVYSVNEVYKYKTGLSAEAFKLATIDTTENLGDEFFTIDYNLKVFGSPVNKNTESVISNYLKYNVLEDINKEFGIDTGKLIKNTYSMSVDSGSAAIDIKINYLSGANPSGFFDYVVSCEKDYLMGVENWKIDGDFRCFGPLDYKIKQLENFKLSNRINESWTNYLTGLITGSPIYSLLHDPDKMFSVNVSKDESENLKVAVLKLSLLMNMGYEPSGVSELKYSINGSPSKWIYELLPSSNIEGSFVVQSLETKTNGIIDMDISAKSYNVENALNSISSYLNKISEVYVDSGTSTNVKSFLIEESFSTGVYDASFSKKFIGNIREIDDVLINLKSINTSNFTVPTRVPGYNFGY